MQVDIQSRCVLLCVGGSRAYGMHLPSSDVDIKGVALPMREHVHGYLHRFEQVEGAEAIAGFLPVLSAEERAACAASKLEGVVYEVRKFIALAADCNPNIMDVLFCRDDEVRVATVAGRELREMAPVFVSQKARHTFTGYAHSQLKRIRLHRQWLLDPPAGKPDRVAHGLPPESLLPRDQAGAVNALVDAGATAEVLGLSEGALELLRRERAYRAAMQRWEQYESWKRQRNPERAALEAKCGYDSKHAAHLVRLLRMGHEILTTGRVNVWRGDIDATELREIRIGAWSYDVLEQYAADMEARVASVESPVVPHSPDRASLDALCMWMVERGLEGER